MDANSPLAFLYRIPGLRQFILLAGLAIAITAGVTATAMLWTASRLSEAIAFI